jgi:hypothetical protein
MGDTILVSFSSAIAAAEAVDLWATHGVVHKSTTSGFGFPQAVAAMGD